MARGKNKKATGDVTFENIIESKRKRQKVVNFQRLKKNSDWTQEGMLDNLVKATDKYEAAMAMQPEAAKRLPSSKSGEKISSKSGEKISSKSGEFPSMNHKPKIRKGKGKLVAKVGERIAILR